MFMLESRLHPSALLDVQQSCAQVGDDNAITNKESGMHKHSYHRRSNTDIVEACFMTATSCTVYVQPTAMGTAVWCNPQTIHPDAFTMQ